MDIVSYMLAVPLVGLQALLFFLLLRGPFRQYWIVLLYSGVQLATSVLEFAIFTSGYALRSALYNSVYRTDEILLDLLLFLMVILLTFQATEGSPLRPAVGKLLAVVVFAALILPFVILKRPLFTGRWYNGTSQLLSFGAAIMNLALWAALIGSKRRDARLLTVSAGLGLMVTAAAIVWGVRPWLPAFGVAQMVIDKLGLVIQIAGTAIWCWAFRRTAQPAAPAPAAIPTNNV